MQDEKVVEISNVWKIFGDNAQAALAAIRERGLSKAEVLAEYNSVVGVADVSLSVNRGEIFCIMGLSGSGKSTLVRHFNRLLEPTAGKIEIEGTDVMALGPRELQRFRNQKIGMVFQNFALMPHRSVLDNVAMPLEIRKVAKNERMRQAAAILDIVELGAWGSKFAHELSGGMQQRVGLARALAANPDVLLMDEPFSALDPLIRTRLQDELLELQERLNKTIIFVSHDLDEAFKIGDRIAIMEGGRIVQWGTPRDIYTAPATPYVADFVANMNPLGVLSARDVMEPAGADASGGIGPDDDIGAVIRSVLETGRPVAVLEGGQPIGQISRESVLARLMPEA
jgi:glycine betaine/proline transport system ATP-binding protein